MIGIRRLTTEDAADYRGIRLAALGGAPEAFGSTYEIEAARAIIHFEQRLADSNIFGVYDESGIIATASLDPGTGAKERHKGFLGGMYVHPDARRRGVGAELMQVVIDHATEIVEQIILTVVQGNRAAIALYERFNFTVYGVEPRSLKTATGYFDEILMVKFLRHPSSK